MVRGRSEPLREGTDILLGEIVRWYGSGRPQDDISILAVEVAAATGLGQPSIDSRGTPLTLPRSSCVGFAVSPYR